MILLQFSEQQMKCFFKSQAILQILSNPTPNQDSGEQLCGILFIRTEVIIE